MVKEITVATVATGKVIGTLVSVDSSPVVSHCVPVASMHVPSLGATTNVWTLPRNSNPVAVVLPLAMDKIVLQFLE